MSEAFERMLAAAEADSGDQSFMAISSALVLLMTPGLAFFYGGMVREKNILNTMMMSLISMGIVSFLWMAYGFSLAFSWTSKYFMFSNLTGMVWPATRISGLLFATYQMTFAIITTAIISGAVVERIRFQAYVLLIIIWLTVIYVPLCNWVWGGGWIFQIGAKDFAGGTVVHISSGTAALVVAAMIGKRKQKTEHPHNVPFVVLGGSLLWFGWTGFNGGSALASNSLAGLAIATTFIAAAVALAAWCACELFWEGRASAIGAMSGAVSGLVGITPIAGFVTPIGSVIVGIVTAVICYNAVKLAGRLQLVDDSLDCFAVHSVGGYTGAILGGLLDKVQGVCYGGGPQLLIAQFIGASSGMLFSAVGTAIIFFALSCIMRVRVLDEQEDGGIDHSMHSQVAYQGEASPNDQAMRSAMATEMETQRLQMEQHTRAMNASMSQQNSQAGLFKGLFCCVNDFADQRGMVVGDHVPLMTQTHPGVAATMPPARAGV
eukprot:TRINITY_DN5925_c2_g1_i1.p1 TRINITY_DN5925_c2_g1~~TRINITY_DN5925_c2_g1_i1.p1  ORF type:complete len:490 (+),score=93.56 TRINITY_DN5925_c2_g1_i1:153-1622(+)